MEEIRIKEAINMLKRYEYPTKLELSEGMNNDVCDNITVSDFMDMKDLAIAALKKQIPKFTIETQEVADIEYICSECNHLNGLRFKYCYNCGQAIISRNTNGL